MYANFVGLSLLFERAGAWLGLASALRRIEASRAYARVEASFFAIPFVVYPIALVALSLAFSALVDRAHGTEVRTGVGDGLPYDFLYLRDAAWREPYRQVASALLADVCLQTVILAAAFVFARARTLSRLDVVVACASVAAFVLLALGRHLLESTDVYNYIAYARAGLPGAYGVAIPIDDDALRRVVSLTWGTALPPSPYGPLWQLYDRAIVGTSSIADAALRLRLVNTVVLLGLFGGLIAAGASRASVLVLALNPYVYQQFVVNAHNDLVPVAALALGAAYVSRTPWPAIVATAVAGLIKLPLLAVGFVIFGAIVSVRTRTLAALGVLAVDGVVSYALGGRPYLDALFAAGTGHVTLRDAAIASMGIAAVVLAFATRRMWWPGLLAIPALRSFLYSWYAMWLAPFSFVGRSAGLPIAIAFPTLGFLLADVYATPRALALTIDAALAIAIAAAAARARTLPA